MAAQDREMDADDYEVMRRQFLRRLPKPLEALEQLAELRATLDRLELVLVHEARCTRHTWEEIGGALGVSRQAAHRRHARAVNKPSGV